ncbi:hypothetical protein N0V84_000570 [Fusarium piperis]|uniref:Ankyrin n=1 Tax=Fusarium piperis TaxID=1435070 RepID=A0A9W9BTW6_9HYPO|nr:hypothetical protein N0V84_000570 [Fusarium piperis]
MVTTLLSRGVDFNTMGHFYGTALQAAARCGHGDMVLQLLSAGAQVNNLQGTWETALRAAIVGGHESVVRTLLQNGADFNLGSTFRTRNYGEIRSSCLQLAVRMNKAGIVNALFEAGAVPSNDESDSISAGVDQSPLIIAAQRGSLAITRALLDSGADVNAVGRKLYNCNSLKNEHGRRLSKWPQDIRNNPPIIEFPKFHRCEQIAAALLDNGASPVSIVKGVAGSPLHMACLIGSKQTVGKLLEKGANANEIGGHFEHVLLIAIATHRPDLVALLLQHGADPNYLHEHYGTPLHLAGKMHSTLSVKHLLQHEADAAKRDAYGNLPLEVALKSVEAERGSSSHSWNEDTVQSLLKLAGGDDEVTKDTLFVAARTQGFGPLFELLKRNKTIAVSEEVVIAAMNFGGGSLLDHFEENVDRLMKRTANLGVTENMLRSIQSLDKIKKLIKYRPFCKVTPELLLSLGNTKSIKLLLEANQDVPVTESLVVHVLRLGGDPWTQIGVVAKKKGSNCWVNTLLDALGEESRAHRDSRHGDCSKV